jgi:hypothetical protein
VKLRESMDVALPASVPGSERVGIKLNGFSDLLHY